MAFCSVYNCKNRSTRNPSIKIFKVPQGNDPFLVNKRLLWQEALTEASGGKHKSVPSPGVCADHFISGEASLDFESPDFVPSVFSCPKETKTHTQETKTDTQGRKTRSQQGKIDTQETKTDTQESKINTQGRKTRSQESKTDTQQSKTDKETTNEPHGRKTRSQGSKTDTIENKTDALERKTRSQEIRTNTQERIAYSSERLTRSQENKIHSQESKTNTQEERIIHSPGRITRSQENKIHSQESKTNTQEERIIHSPGRITRSQENKTNTQEERIIHSPGRITRSQENKTNTQEERIIHSPGRITRSQESKTDTQGRKTRSQESKTDTQDEIIHSPGRLTRSQERKTHSQENKTCTQERIIHSPERLTGSQERVTRSQENKILLQEGIKHSLNSKTHSQERKTGTQESKIHKRKRKRHRWSAESENDETAPDLRPSPLRDAQNELSDEEETLWSPSVLKEGDTLTEDEGTDAEKEAPNPQTTPRQHEIPPSVPADIAALIRSRPVVRLKRLLAPTGGFRCEVCSDVFMSTSLLVTHRKLHEENSSFICEICGISFTVQKEFAEHQGNHPKLEPDFPCNICDRSFSTIQLLKRHKLLHVKDGRKCLKCGALFCRRHNHLLFLPKVKSECEGESGEESEEQASSQESPKVNCGLIKVEDTTMETELSRVAETAGSAESTQMVVPPRNVPLLTVSVVPVLRVFRESPMASTPPPHRQVLPAISLPAAELPPGSPLPTLLPTALHPPPAAPLPPPASPHPPVLKISIDDFRSSGQSKKEESGPPAAETLVPKSSECPPSLKMNLTSALLEVKRNYEYIFNKPKRFKGVVKKEESEPAPVPSRRRSVKAGLRQRVAYDLEIVL